MQKLQQVFLLVLLFSVVGSSVSGMDPEEYFPEEFQETGAQAAQEVIDKTVEAGAQVVEGLMNLPETVKQKVEEAKQVVAEEKSKLDSPEQSTVESNASENDNAVDLENQDELNLLGFKVDRSQLKLYGAGALVAITVCGVTYVLYKNGTLKQWGTAVKDNPARSAIVVATLGMIAYGAASYAKQAGDVVAVLEEA